MKKIFVFTMLVLVISCLTAMGCFADTYEYYPDSEGYYTITYDAQPDNEYIMIAIKGVFDETNYVEAYNAAQDEDILYYEQLASNADGIVKFGPFVPTSYSDSTIIIGGTSLSQPVLAGYLRTGGYSSIAGLEIKNVDDTYTAPGLEGEDIVINVDAVLLDAFGYPAITDQEAVISVDTQLDGVMVDTIESTVRIDRCSTAGTVTIVATYGEYTDSVTVNVVREKSKANHVIAYVDSRTKAEIEKLTLDLVEGESSSTVTIYSETHDQYDEPLDESRTSYIDGVENVFPAHFIFSAVGEYEVKIASDSDENVYTLVDVTVKSRPAYTGNSLALYNLLKECEQELALVGNTKFVSENGKDVYPEYVWTTSAKKTAFDEKIAEATSALELFNAGELQDTDLASYITSLTSAKNAYTSSFKAGLRVDITSIEINKKNIRIPITNAKVALDVTIAPSSNTDTITWQSSDPETVSVDKDGNLTALENGTVVITATTSTGISSSTVVTAYTKATRLQLSESTINLTYGVDTPYLLKVTASPATQSEILTWTSSKPDVATVDSNGLITPKCKAGSTTILVVGEHGLAAECIVKVSLPDWETVSAPVANIPQGNVSKGTELVLSTPTETAKIYYTLDGSEPTSQSRPYTQPIAINKDMTVNAIAIADKMFDSDIVSFTYTVKVPKLTVSETVISAGNSSSMTISLEDNTGINHFSAKITLPQGVTLSTVQRGSALSSLEFEYGATGENIYLLTWSGSQDDDTNGVIATLELTAAQNVTVGEYYIGLSEIVISSENNDSLDFECQDGKITVSNIRLGDANNDTKINIQDVILLAQYCADWESAKQKANIAALDTNGDGSINTSDVILLAQYCAGWDVTLG